MKVCVIGAGPAGLTTIKQLLDEEHEVVCFERQSSLGGIWYRHDGDAAETKAYDEIILTISMKLMSFSDFIYKGERKFETQKGYLAYLQAYADKFGLTERIRFDSTVTKVRKDGDDWVVTVERHGVSTEFKFGAVALCTGPFRAPNLGTSAVEQLDKFSGEVIHSSRYRNNKKFRDKKVLVVGLAESGADLLREISDVSAKCTLSVRSRTFLLPRLPDGKHATDNITVRAHHYELYVRASEIPFPLASIFEDEDCSRTEFLEASRVYGMMLLAQQALRMAAGTSDTDATAGVNPLGGPAQPLQLDVRTELTQEALDFINDWNRKSHNGESTYSPKIIFCKNVSFVPNILNGKVRVDDSGITSIEGRTVRFQSGAVEEFDIIVLCTGFKLDFSVFENVQIPDNNVRNLYKHAFHPRHNGRLAVIGVCRPFTGGIPICAEMQARYFALLCSGKLELPADVDDRIKREKEWEERWTEYSPRCFDAIPSQIFFCDSIAAEIGCLPTASQLIAVPELFVKLWFNSFNQTAYRLTGPHSMPDEARQELMRVELPLGSVGFIAGMIKLLDAPTGEHPKHGRFALPGPLPRQALSSLEEALRSTARLALTRS